MSDTVGVGAGHRGGQHVGPKVADELVRLRRLRRGGRVGGEHGGVTGGVEDRSGHGGDAGVGLQRVVDAVHGHLVGRVRELDDDLDRAVEPGAEALGQLVERRALRGVRRGVAVVGHADPHAEGRHGDGAQGAEAHDGVADRVAADVVRPAAGDRLVGRLGDVGLAVDRQLVDLRPGQAEQAGEERDGGGHRDRDDQRHRCAHGADGREPGEEQPEDGDDDRGAGEEHGLAGGGVGGAGGVLDAHAVVEELAVPGDDEQRVVDAHAEADHGAEDQGELGDVHDGGQHADAGDADEDADQRGADGQAHRHDGAEGDEQDDDRHADADELAARLLRRQQGEGTGQLDLHTIGLGLVGHGHGIVQLLGRQLVERRR